MGSSGVLRALRKTAPGKSNWERAEIVDLEMHPWLEKCQHAVACPSFSPDKHINAAFKIVHDAFIS